MTNLPQQDNVQRAPIFGVPVVSNDGTIYLQDKRDEQMDPNEENADPKPIEPVGNYRNNENPANVDDRSSIVDEDDEEEMDETEGFDDAEAGDDEDAMHPITSQNR